MSFSSFRHVFSVLIGSPQLIYSMCLYNTFGMRQSVCAVSYDSFSDLVVCRNGHDKEVYTEQAMHSNVDVRDRFMSSCNLLVLFNLEVSIMEFISFPRALLILFQKTGYFDVIV